MKAKKAKKKLAHRRAAWARMVQKMEPSERRAFKRPGSQNPRAR